MGTLQSVARDVQRSAPFRLVRSADEAEGDGRSLTGYAAVFGQPTEIDSWEGRFTETIRKGAFRKSIRENTPVMQYDHGRHPLIGSIPIGRIENLREDDEGLFTEARLTDNWLIQPVRDAIAEGSISGMSFRFEVVREEWRDVNGKLVKPEEVLDLLWMPGDRGPLQRELIELKVRELGPVCWPAYAGTSVGVRARDMAEGILHSDDLTRQIRRSLARDAAVPQVPEDPELRREVAAALLSRTDAPPEEGHPSGPDTPQDGAPPEEGHPPQHDDPDAPPADGHPSQPARANPLRDQIREITGLMGETLALIDTKDNS
ncbi:HK97 family phage prohead protease [Streptomyces sp. RTd22]|uniref:HK97 family phage prohead protease n=1 Tax=Streptomyces sp. RTd22 TaxID=1841249 RepID=UPI000AF8A375|nr:HK97 family phage prohead protease [Streptomyces sp. RTd22]